MSRSRRKTPRTGNTTAASEKDDKRRANRAFRKRIRDILQINDDPDVLPALQEIASNWQFAKDGKQWLDNPLSKWMRK